MPIMLPNRHQYAYIGQSGLGIGSGEVICMVVPEGKCVKRYKTENCTVEIWDGAYAGKTEEELEAIRLEARRIACEIIDMARARGVEV